MLCIPCICQAKHSICLQFGSKHMLPYPVYYITEEHDQRKSCVFFCFAINLQTDRWFSHLCHVTTNRDCAQQLSRCSTSITGIPNEWNSVVCVRCLSKCWPIRAKRSPARWQTSVLLLKLLCCVSCIVVFHYRYRVKHDHTLHSGNIRKCCSWRSLLKMTLRKL